MKTSWNDIKWIFEPDGSLRDIYIHAVSLHDWETVIDLINEKYTVNYGVSLSKKEALQINKDEVFEYLTDETGEIEVQTASISFGNTCLNCHFFSIDEIEFDLDPKEMNTIEDFELLEAFMHDISASLDKPISLTYEDTPKFSLIKIDANRGINDRMLEEEVRKYW